MELSIFVSLVVATLFGLTDALYLAWKHGKKEKLHCPIGGNGCNIVTESKWNSFFGIRTEFLGIIYYLIIFLMLYLLWNQNIEKYYLVLISFIALGFSAFLVYVQKYIIKEYCFYCLISAFINLLIFVFSVSL